MAKSGINRRDFLKAVAGGAAAVGISAGLTPSGLLAEELKQTASTNPLDLTFGDTGHTDYGDWQADAIVTPNVWRPSQSLSVSTTLHVTPEHIAALTKAKNIKPDGFCLLVTAERTFDAGGVFRQVSDERMSTLLTPTGLAIEGGITGAATNRFGYVFRTPVDIYATKTLAETKKNAIGEYEAVFSVSAFTPSDLPPGIYRIRLDYGFTVRGSRFNLNGETFARRPFFKSVPTHSHLFSPPIRASGTHASGMFVNGLEITPRVPWILMGDYNSNGYKGVVADEDSQTFALSPRNIIPDEVILPLYGSDNKTILSYSLEPQFPTDTIEARSNIPWDNHSGQLSVQITAPDGKVTDLGTAAFNGNRGQFPTTGKSAFTAWKPAMYGRYTVKAAGWTADVWGNRYAGGGTYHFWIAKRMTMATATFQGFAYPVGTKYGRDIGFAPSVPADVDITATLYVNSDINNVKSISFSGKASPAGIHGTAQGAQQLLLDSPGEYHARILAKYTDQEKHLWVCAMRHAGVVYAADTPVVARGKKLVVADKYLDRGETHFEGWVESADVSHLAHINYPYQSGDVLLIASEQQGANKIEPVLLWEDKANPAPYDTTMQTIGATNLKLKTYNGYSPHMFPEFITDREYYYAGAPRPGFMSRFLVGDDGVRAPYWPTSPNAFGGQVNASNNGDLPGDIYRLIGGIVKRPKGLTPSYAGYLSSAFLLPKGTNNNRVIAAGAEDLNGSCGQKAKFYLVGLRPGMVYETGTTFTAVAQIDPIVPATVTFTLTYPDGHQVTTQNTGDSFGSFAGKDKWVLDAPGIYRYWIEGDWQGNKGFMSGLPASGGEMYVIEKERPSSSTLKLSLPEQSTFEAKNSLTVSGTSTATSMHYAAVSPGAVIDVGETSVVKGKFQYLFDPAAIARKVATYDTKNLVTGKPEIMDVVHLTFFSEEIATDGSKYHAFARLIIRGTTVIYAY
jgi:hypothetical protein